jgi:arylsulfatase A-like enzyme
MGYKTPNIDRIAREGVGFHRLLRPAELHGGPRGLHQRLGAGAFRHDQGRHARRQGRLAKDRRHDGHVLKSQGYATGQFGKNHQGDRDEHLPTMHGFDEFMGSLYHLNAEEEPENRDYPRDMKLPNGKTFLRSSSARVACSSARPTARAARPSRTSAR